MKGASNLTGEQTGLPGSRVLSLDNHPSDEKNIDRSMLDARLFAMNRKTLSL